MPNCIQFFRKGESEPIKLAALDDEVCAHIGAEPHSTQYVCGWFDCIAYRVATSDDTLETVAQRLEEHSTCWPHVVEDGDTKPISKTDDMFARNLWMIACFLRDNFTTNAWVEIGKRA